jgi:hypothetical protein
MSDRVEDISTLRRVGTQLKKIKSSEEGGGEEEQEEEPYGCLKCASAVSNQQSAWMAFLQLPCPVKTCRML